MKGKGDKTQSVREAVLAQHNNRCNLDNIRHANV